MKYFLVPVGLICPFFAIYLSYVLSREEIICVCVCSVLSDSLQLHGPEPTRLLCPWHFPGKDSRVGFHFLLLVKRRNYPRQLNQGVRIFGKPSQNSVSHTCAILSCFSCVWLFVTLWTIAHQAPLSMEFSRQEYWGGLPFSLPGDLPNTGMEPSSTWALALQTFLPLSYREAHTYLTLKLNPEFIKHL